MTERDESHLPLRRGPRLLHWGWLLLAGLVMAVLCVWLGFWRPLVRIRELTSELEGQASFGTATGLRPSWAQNQLFASFPCVPPWERFLACRTTGADFDLSNLLEVAALARTESITVTGDFRNEDLKGIGACCDLKALHFYGASLSDQGLQDVCRAGWLEELEIGHTHVTSGGLRPLTDLTRLRTLTMAYLDVGEKGGRTLADCRSLECVTLYDSSAIGLGTLKGLPSLRNLCLIRATIDEPTLKQICSIDALTVLHVLGEELTGAGLSSLSPSSDLELVHLSGTHLTDDGLKSLARCSKLYRLHFDDTQVTDEGIRSLSGHPKLAYVIASGTQLTDLSAETFATMRELKELDLSGTDITDASLAHLAKLPKLQSLYLSRTRVTRAGLDALLSSPQLEHVIVDKALDSDRFDRTLSSERRRIMLTPDVD